MELGRGLALPTPMPGLCEENDEDGDRDIGCVRLAYEEKKRRVQRSTGPVYE